LVLRCRRLGPAGSRGLAEADGAGEIDRDALGDTALGHRHAKEAVEARHRDAVVRDHQKTGAGGVGDLAEEAAESFDIGVVERRVDLVEDANRRGVGQKHRKDQRECRQDLLKEKASDARADRIERKKVIALAQAREIDAILVTELSRWGRSTTDLEQMLQSLRARDVPVLAISGLQFNLSAPRGKMIASVMAALAEFARDLIGERIKSGIATAKFRGKAARPPTRTASIGPQRDKGPQVDRGWSELPVDRPPCRAQQRHGRGNPATRACGEPTKASVIVPKIVMALSDKDSGRVSATRGARDEHSTLPRHGFLVSK
jgi:DNA invertase Pin-like site-specific DNA recombinase